jgi:hypothetical protein
MGKVKEKQMLDGEAQVKNDAARWVEIHKTEKLLAKEKEEIENRLRLHVKETGEVLIGDLIQAYNKSSSAKIAAINPEKDSAELLEKFINHWKTDAIIGKMLIKTSCGITDLRKCCKTYTLVATSLKKYGLEIKEGESSLQFKHV